MEDTALLTWKEKLERLARGKSLPCDNPQSVYSAIRDNPDTFKDKKFSVRKHPVTSEPRVIRTK